MQLIGRVEPAARQCFSGGEVQIRFGKPFRFLQLFCENNNTDMKHFLLKQQNNDGSDKLVVINFVQEACQLLR